MKNEQGKIEKMNSNINEIIEQSNVFFDNSENIFISLENDTKNYDNGFWGTSILIEQTPFDFERSQIKRGKRLLKPPQKKADKFFHLQNEKGNIVAIFGYIENYELPGSYIFIQKDRDIEKIYRFDILKKMVSFQQRFFENDLISQSIEIQKNGNSIVEFYHYDKSNRLIEIERKHKDRKRFNDTSFFPDHIFPSKFILEYTGRDTQPTKILWDANSQNELREIWTK